LKDNVVFVKVVWMNEESYVAAILEEIFSASKVSQLT